MLRQICRLGRQVKPTNYYKSFCTIKPPTTKSQFLSTVSDFINNYNGKLDNLPTLFTIGPQSAGKTSVIEALCGQDIFPKNMGMATMKPMVITVIQSNELKFRVGDNNFTSIENVREEIRRQNANSQIKQVGVTIYSPGVQNLFLVDLPGLISYNEGDNDQELPKLIKNICKEYLEKDHMIPIIVTTATMDPATNQALALVQKYKKSDKSIGFITKTDLAAGQNNDMLSGMLNNKSYKLGNGWIALVLRNAKEVSDGMTVNKKIEEEVNFFKKTSLSPSGVLKARESISNIQFNKIKSEIPNLLADIDRQIADLKESYALFEKLAKDPQKDLAIKLESLIKKLIDSSPDRSAFEMELRTVFLEKISGLLDAPIDQTNIGNMKHSHKLIDKNIYKFLSTNRTNPVTFIKDKFRELFCYGLVSPIVVNESTLENAFKQECELLCLASTIDFYIDDPIGKKRLDWYNFLDQYFENLNRDNIEKTVYEITKTMIIEYINRTNKNEISKKFSEYIVEVIGSEAYDENIKYSIKSMVNIEKRPFVTAASMLPNIIKMYPEHFKYQGSILDALFKKKNKLRMEVYSKEWNIIYLQTVSQTIAENCCRVVAVNLLCIMVRKLLEMTGDMFNKDSVLKQQEVINSKLTKLNEMRAIISEYNSEFSCTKE